MATQQTDQTPTPDNDRDFTGFGHSEEDVATEPTPPEPSKPSHPDVLVRRARLLGIDDSTIDKINTDQLDALVFNQHRKLTLQEVKELQEATARAPKPGPDEDDEEEADDDDDEAEFAKMAEDWDPGIVKVLKKQAAKLKELKELKAAVAKGEEREKQRQTRTNEEAYDMAFESLGAKYEKIVGKGEGRELAPDSKEMKRRIAILRDAGLDLDLDGPTTIKRKLIKAAEGLYGDFAVDPVPEAPAPEPGPYDAVDKKRPTKEQWKEAGVAVPTNRRTKAPNGEQAAREAVRDFYRAHGITSGEDAEQLSGIPD